MPHRLRRYFALLVVGPAVLFAGLGIYTAWRSRAELVIEVQRDAASRASEQVRSYRDRVHDRLAVPLDSLRHAISGPGARYTVYDDRGAVIDNHPPDANPVQLDLGGGRGDALLLAARRGSAAVDVIWLEGSPLWLAYIPSHDTLAVVLESVDLGFVNSLISGASGLTAALYIDDGLVAAVGSDWPPALRSTLADSLLELDRALATSLRGSDAAIAPVKDFDDWDIIGAIAVRLEGRASSIPELPIAPLLALILSVALAGPTVWWTVTRGLTLRPLVAPARARHLRRGFALALLPPALAATWLASSDASLSARATDALLDLSHGIVRNEVQLGRKLHLSAASRIARLSGAEVIRLSSDSIADAASLQIPAEMLQTAEGSAGRLRSGDLVYSYRSIDLIDGSRLFLLRTPLEEARKGALFWLAGLYGALAVGFLIFASLAATSDSTLALHEARTAWAFITPSLILLLLFSAAPLLFSLYLSFHGWNLLEDAKPLVGLRHYIELAGDGLFWNAAKNTALYSLYVPLTMACALGVALLLNRSIKGVALLRAVFFLPYITSFVAISIVWQWLYEPDFGLFNWLLSRIGLGPFPWLNSPSTALLALIIMAVWIHIGFQMVIFLAGLQAIPNEYYEAAAIDGAGPWRRFRRITLPLLRPTTFFVLVTSIIGSFQVFTFVYVMTEGGPLHATDVIVYHIYQNAWQFLRMGYASAMSWVLFAVIFAITLLQFRLLGRKMTPG